MQTFLLYSAYYAEGDTKLAFPLYNMAPRNKAIFINVKAVVRRLQRQLRFGRPAELQTSCTQLKCINHTAIKALLLNMKFNFFMFLY